MLSPMLLWPTRISRPTASAMARRFGSPLSREISLAPSFAASTWHCACTTARRVEVAVGRTGRRALPSSAEWRARQSRTARVGDRDSPIAGGRRRRHAGGVALPHAGQQLIDHGAHLSQRRAHAVGEVQELHAGGDQVVGRHAIIPAGRYLLDARRAAGSELPAGFASDPDHARNALSECVQSRRGRTIARCFINRDGMGIAGRSSLAGDAAAAFLG